VVGLLLAETQVARRLLFLLIRRNEGKISI
jgi:hypothetical protein